MRPVTKTLICIAAFAASLAPLTASAQHELVAGLEGTSGSTVGPDGALYVTERLAGRVSRVDPWTGDTTTFAEGLPVPVIDIGLNGAIDVAFIDGIAYVLVTVVGPAFDFIEPGIGGTDPVGIYRVDGPGSFEVIADIGAWSKANPPSGFFFLLDHGVQYAIEPFRGGLLVTDGHHNRVLWVSLDGEISEFKAFGQDTVPTGLEVHGKTVLLAEAGPTPHMPADGKVVAIDAKSRDVTDVSAGAPLAVDVEFGVGRALFALGQGEWSGLPEEAGKPAEADTGQLLRVNGDGSMTVLVDGLDRPTSMEFIGNTAFIVSLNGSIVFVEDVGAPPFGRAR